MHPDGGRARYDAACASLSAQPTASKTDGTQAMFGRYARTARRAGLGLAAMLTLAATAASSPRPAAPDPLIGVYYFPGWLRSDWGPKGGWEPIKPYRGLKPLLGWYDQGSPAVLARQLRWMADHGIDYVAMDWYYGAGDVRLDEGLRAYLAVPQSRVKLSLFWANHGEATTPAIWRAVVGAWIDRYLRSPRFLRVDDRPVVFIFSYDKLAADAAASGSSAAAYVAEARLMMRRAGLPPLYLVAGLDDFTPALVRDGAMAAGFDAVSAYQIHRKSKADERADPDWGKPTRGWPQVAASYAAQWRQGLKLEVPMVVPMISGFDRRPWRDQVGDPGHGVSVSTDAQWRAHLLAARRVLAAQAARRGGHGPQLGAICCWNEFGEGSYIEPTAAGGMARLRAVKDVFGP